MLNEIQMDPLWIRLGIFIVVLFAISVVEYLFPRRADYTSGFHRKFTNISLVFMGAVLVRWAVPISLAGTALVWEENSWGILNLIVLPEPVKLFVVMVLFDLAIYWQHRIFHIVPFLWRIHKVHHADSAFDVTTGFRFHPAEILVSVLFKMVLIVILGPSPESILIFEIVLSAAAMFSHANIRFPLGVDRVLRYAIVTPDMHRIHHSVNDNEMNKNFGFFLAVWDKVFGSYVQTPQEGQEKLVVGLSRYRNQNPSLFWWCLILPFRRNK